MILNSLSELQRLNLNDNDADNLAKLVCFLFSSSVINVIFFLFFFPWRLQSSGASFKIAKACS